MTVALASATVQTVEVVGVHQRAVAGVRRLRDIATGDDLANRQPERGRELPVTLVVARNGHDRAGAVPGQHVVGDEDRHLARR